MTIFTTTWNDAYSALPPDNEVIAQGASRIRNFKVATRERLAVDHSMAGDASDGEHTKISFFAPIATPTNASNKSFLYTKDVGGKPELHYLDEDGNELQITNAGSFNLVTNIVGDIKGSYSSTPSAGWYNLNGDTIGNSSSGATHNGDQMEALYLYLWNTISDTYAPVSTGRGGSAAADWAANKTIGIPNEKGRSPVMVGQGTDSNAVNKTFTLAEHLGEYQHVMTVSELVTHSHGMTGGTFSAAGGAANVTPTSYPGSVTTTQNAGSSTAMPWMHPVFGMYFQIFGG